MSLTPKQIKKRLSNQKQYKKLKTQPKKVEAFKRKRKIGLVKFAESVEQVYQQALAKIKLGAIDAMPNTDVKESFKKQIPHSKPTIATTPDIILQTAGHS